MRWLPCVLALLLLTAAEGGRWRNCKVSWYSGRPGYVAARFGVARKGDRVVIARKDGSRAKRYEICCEAKLRPGRAFDLTKTDFARYARPSQGETSVRYRIEGRR